MLVVASLRCRRLKDALNDILIVSVQHISVQSAVRDSAVSKTVPDRSLNHISFRATFMIREILHKLNTKNAELGQPLSDQRTQRLF